MQQNKKLKVLLIAYACEPHSISESFLAYETILGLARRMSESELHVLTRRNNLPECHADAAANELGIHWHGVDCNRAVLWLKKRLPLFSIQSYVVFWQYRAVKEIKCLNEKHGFHVIHGLSLMALSNFSTGLSDVPGVIGPIGGAQKIPSACRKYGDPIQEIPRNLSIGLMPLVPKWKQAFKSDIPVICANEETYALIEKIRGTKQGVLLRQPGYPDISTHETSVETGQHMEKADQGKTFRIFWGGRLIRSKGLELLLEAVGTLKEHHSCIRVHITGDGPDRAYFQRVVQRHNIGDMVVFHGWVLKEDMEKIRRSSDLLVFTSLRETTGLALIEMLLSGTPTAVLDCGGPKEIIRDTPCIHIDPQDAIGQLKNAIESQIQDPQSSIQASLDVQRIARTQFDWDHYLDFLCEQYMAVAT